MLVLACLLLAACSENESERLLGYVEADAVRVASPVGGQLASLAVDRGDEVKAGQPLFTLEQQSEKSAVDEANAKVKQARAQSNDLDLGKRPDELAVYQADLRAAEAALRQSDSELKRQRELAKAGFVSANGIDAFAARRDADAAKVAELQAQLRSAKLAGRDAARAAAQAGATAAEAQLAQRQWTLSQKAVAAPVAARVEDSYYRVGEWVPAGAPVLSLLAPSAIKVRFYVPETRLASMKPGTAVRVGCDGCGQGIAATVRFVARDAEFTPPVIYSKENRAKLVWLVEAVPAAKDAARLLPGQPVDVVAAGKP
jgi:HlyD family secretion protein